MYGDAFKNLIPMLIVISAVVGWAFIEGIIWFISNVEIGLK